MNQKIESEIFKAW